MSTENKFEEAARTIQNNEQFFNRETELQTQDANHIPNIQEYVQRVSSSSEAMKFLKENCQAALNQINQIMADTAPQQENQ